MVSICSIRGKAGAQSTIFFRPAVFHHGLALHQSLVLQTIEQACQGRAFDADTLGQFALGRRLFKTRQMQQHQPARLRQAQPGEATIQFGTPATGHLGQLHTKAMLIG